MGDEVLMKKLMIIPALVINIFASTGEIKNEKEALILEYRDMFKRISQKRIGVEESKIDDLSAPFLKVEKKVEAPQVDVNETFVAPFELQATFGQKAKISGKWYKLNDSVDGMKLISIKQAYVWLKSDESRKKLIMGSKNEKISIK